MTKVLLISPPSPEQLGAPLLGLQYVAASLLERGHDVRVVDAAARHSHPSADEIVAEIDAYGPDAVGVGLFTQLRGRVPLLVAGGAHATVRPDETLAYGFDVAVTGEAEHAIVELVARLDQGER